MNLALRNPADLVCTNVLGSSVAMLIFLNRIKKAVILIHVKRRIVNPFSVISTWQPISTAPFDRELQLAVVDANAPTGQRNAQESRVLPEEMASICCIAI